MMLDFSIPPTGGRYIPSGRELERDAGVLSVQRWISPDICRRCLREWKHGNAGKGLMPR